MENPAPFSPSVPPPPNDRIQNGSQKRKLSLDVLATFTRS